MEFELGMRDMTLGLWQTGCVSCGATLWLAEQSKVGSLACRLLQEYGAQGGALSAETLAGWWRRPGVRPCLRIPQNSRGWAVWRGGSFESTAPGAASPSAETHAGSWRPLSEGHAKKFLMIQP